MEEEEEGGSQTNSLLTLQACSSSVSGCRSDKMSHLIVRQEAGGTFYLFCSETFPLICGGECKYENVSLPSVSSPSAGHCPGTSSLARHQAAGQLNESFIKSIFAITFAAGISRLS